MRVYLAGPMTGIPLHNFPAFDAVEALLTDRGHEVINPARLVSRNDDGGPDAEACAHPREWFMRRELPLVASCEAIVLLTGWGTSQGARTELFVALACELPVYEFAAGVLRDMTRDEVEVRLIGYRQGRVA